MKRALLVALTDVMVSSCVASAELRSRYATEVARCVANEREIVDRQWTTLEQDQEDLATERARCDAALAAIGGGR